MVGQDSGRVLTKLVHHWSEIQTALRRVNGQVIVRPDDARSIFIPDNTVATSIAFDIKPFVLNLPEKAQHPKLDLYVVIEGRLKFDKDHFNANGGELKTHEFGTHVAYFKNSNSQLDHIFGAHYDFAFNHLAHPAFHAQIGSFMNLADEIRKNFRPERPNGKDMVSGLMRTVRIPIAQLDVFSLMSQIIADHLMNAASGRQEKAAFNNLLDKGSFLKGAGYRVPKFADQAAHLCYRGNHWYPAIA